MIPFFGPSSLWGYPTYPQACVVLLWRKITKTNELRFLGISNLRISFLMLPDMLRCVISACRNRTCDRMNWQTRFAVRLNTLHRRYSSMNTATRNLSISGVWVFSCSRCVVVGVRSMPKTLNKCTRTFVSARLGSRKALSTMMENNSSKGWETVPFSSHVQF